mgnify:CR=1 FL=1
MDRLKIEEGIRDLVGQLWKHGYRTTNSGEGDESRNQRAYVMFTGGDGWLEDNASRYGLEKQTTEECCQKYKGLNCCADCGAGLNGNSIYRGRLRNPSAVKTVFM